MPVTHTTFCLYINQLFLSESLLLSRKYTTNEAEDSRPKLHRVPYYRHDLG